MILFFPERRVLSSRVSSSRPMEKKKKKNSTRYFPNAIPFPVDSKNNLLAS